MTAAVPRPVDRRTATLDTAHLDLRDDFWSTCLLLVLSERAADSFELGEQLRGLGQLDDDPGRVSDTLLEFEHSGLVRAVGEGSAGRGAKTYCLTCEGSERLGRASDELRGTLVMLGRFLARFGEHLELPQPGLKGRTAGPLDA